MRRSAVREFMSRFLSDETGTTAVEYALIASLAAVVIIGAVGGMGQALLGMFQNVLAAFP